MRYAWRGFSINTNNLGCCDDHDDNNLGRCDDHDDNNLGCCDDHDDNNLGCCDDYDLCNLSLNLTLIPGPTPTLINSVQELTSIHVIIAVLGSLVFLLTTGKKNNFNLLNPLKHQSAFFGITQF